MQQVIRGISPSLMDNFYFDTTDGRHITTLEKLILLSAEGKYERTFHWKGVTTKAFLCYHFLKYDPPWHISWSALSQKCFHLWGWGYSNKTHNVSLTRSFFSTLHLSLPAPPFSGMFFNVPLFHERVKKKAFVSCLFECSFAKVTTKLSDFKYFNITVLLWCLL